MQNTTTDDSPVQQAEGKTGIYVPDLTIRPTAPVILFDTSAPTDLDPDSYPICKHGMLLIDCSACVEVQHG